MKFTSEYTWLESYLEDDALWLEDVLTWDDTFDLLWSDYDLFSFLTNPFFLNSHLFLDSITKMSFLDVLFFSETESSKQFSMFTFFTLLHFCYLSRNCLHQWNDIGSYLHFYSGDSLYSWNYNFFSEFVHKWI